MFVMLLLLVLVLILTLVLVTCNTKKTPPGPFQWPFIGNLLLLSRLTRKFGSQHIAFMELSKRYKSHLISLSLGSTKVVVVSGNKYINYLLKNDEFNFRPWNEFIAMRNFGKKQGITMNDGEDWVEMRKWTVWSLKTLGFGKQDMLDMIKNELVTILNKLENEGVHQLKPLFVPAAINVIWTLATGKPFGDNQKLQYFTNLMDRRAQAFDISGGILAAFPWFCYIAPEISGYNVVVTLNNKLKNFIMETINDHKKQYSPQKNDDLINMFLHKMYEENNSNSVFTEEQLMMVLVDLFLAGTTTTSTTMEFLCLNVALHPDIQRKVQQEIDSVVPINRLPELNDRPKLPYTEAVISEVQRLWPIFPIIGPRTVVHDVTIDDYMIPKDSNILVNTYSVSMDPEVFDDPYTFNPERFIEDGVYKANVNLITFGKGKRRCPGESLARSMIFLLFSSLMQKYSILPVPNKGPTSIDINPGFVITPKPYEMLIVKR